MNDMTAPEKTCGDCNVCCKDMLIDVPELQKLPGVLCAHYKPGAGCGIYDERPAICRNFLCGWRVLALDDSWRPDRSQILIMMVGGPSPDGLMDGVRFEFVGGIDKVYWPPFVTFATSLVRGNVPVYLSVPGKIGESSGKAYVNSNTMMRNAARQGNLAMAATLFSQALQGAIDLPRTPIRFASVAKEKKP
jgi:hypothetical protein